jgi:DNA-binding transcriptional regulator YdaS (Cro superfamily)
LLHNHVRVYKEAAMTPLEKAMQTVGGASALASAIGVSTSAPSMWRVRGNVPAEHCPAIEQATNGAVRCEELRPDVAWCVLRVPS